MELFYNPDLMPEEEIRKTFVARHGLVDELISMIERQPDGAGVQHVIIVAPRGMGKTTVLLMAQFAIRDRSLGGRWQTVRFPEESYGIYDLADLWIEVLNRLAAETNDPELGQSAERLKRECSSSDDLQEAALAVIKDWRRKRGKRLLLLVDNFDLILGQINDERDNARLRNVLMNDGTMMLLGAATTFFHEARAYDQPLYNFFKIYDLDSLKFADMQELLRQRAALDGQTNFEATLKANAGRLRALGYFTGGNPRLVLMLYRVVAQSEILEVRRGLEKLLDEVTPYYKAKIEGLPPQQRKILDYIARISSETHQGQTPTEIAIATRLPANQASAQLKRLSDLGYVQAANLRGRSSYYTLSEPLYAIWHQMRSGHDARRRVQWLVEFLKVWYEGEELATQSRRLELRFRELLSAGRPGEAREALEYRRYLAEAMAGSLARAGATDAIIRDYLELKDTATLKEELLPTIQLEELSAETLNALFKAGCSSPEELSAAVNKLGIAAFEAGRFAEALQHFNSAIEIRPADFDAWLVRGVALGKLGKHEEALASYDRALEIRRGSYDACLLRGGLLTSLGRYEEALAGFDHALETHRDSHDAWFFRGGVLALLRRYEEAVASFDRALEIKPDGHEAWFNRGVALDSLGRHEEALGSFDRALETKADWHAAWSGRGIALANLGKHEEALASFDRALEIKADWHEAWLFRGGVLALLRRYEEAVASFDRAAEIEARERPALGGLRPARLGTFLVRVWQDKINQAREDWAELLKSAKQPENWHEVLSMALLEVAQAGHLEFSRQLIAESGLEEPLFPLARALDYLLTRDEALVEKLSPEVRNVVKEIVSKLGRATDQAEQPKTKSRRAKSGSGLRRRTMKQLR